VLVTCCGSSFNPNNLTEFDIRKSVEKVGHQWLKVNETIGSRSKDHNSYWQIGCALLKCQIAVDGDENVESARGPYEKLAIANPGPAEL
jgi:hypothetical protein